MIGGFVTSLAQPHHQACSNSPPNSTYRSCCIPSFHAPTRWACVRHTHTRLLWAHAGAMLPPDEVRRAGGLPERSGRTLGARPPGGMSPTRSSTPTACCCPTGAPRSSNSQAVSWSAPIPMWPVERPQPWMSPTAAGRNCPLYRFPPQLVAAAAAGGRRSHPLAKRGGLFSRPDPGTRPTGSGNCHAVAIRRPVNAVCRGLINAGSAPVRRCRDVRRGQSRWQTGSRTRRQCRDAAPACSLGTPARRPPAVCGSNISGYAGCAAAAATSRGTPQTQVLWLHRGQNPGRDRVQQHRRAAARWRHVDDRGGHRGLSISSR